MEKDGIVKFLNEYMTSLETIITDVEAWDKTFPSINIIKKIRPHIIKTKQLIDNLIINEIPQYQNQITELNLKIKNLEAAVHKINNKLNDFTMLESLLQQTAVDE